MRVVTFRPREKTPTWIYPEGFIAQGILRNDLVIDIHALWSNQQLEAVKERIRKGEQIQNSGTSMEIWKLVAKVGVDLQSVTDDDLLRQEASLHQLAWHRDDVVLGQPTWSTRTLRDFYAFEQHVKTANENRGRSVPEEWYQFPVFYYTYPGSIYGPNDTIPYPSYSNELDYELEIACIIGKAGINVPADQAEDYIFGFTVMNDWSARDVQRLEMKIGLGPVKGKDFATSLGPCIVTLDELADRYTGRPGVYDLEMVARVNGVERSRGNMKDLYWSFGQMIERASQDVMLHPGDVIGSGTVGTGCLLELTKGQGPWLQPGDVVEMEIERIGVLRNVVGEKKQAISDQLKALG